MPFAKETRFSRDVLRQSPRLGAGINALGLLMLAFQLVELAITLLLLRLWHTPPIVLFFHGALGWRLLQLALQLPGALVLLWYRWHLWLAISKAIGLLPHPAAFYSRWQMLGLSVLGGAIRILVLQGVPLCLFFACRLALLGARQQEGALFLFGAIQLVVLAVLLLLAWLYLCIGLWCAPFFWLYAPETALWRVPLFALGAMRGRRTLLLGQLAWYGIRMLPLVTIPWVLPQMVVATVTYLHIAVREYAQAHNGPMPLNAPDTASASAS